VVLDLVLRQVLNCGARPARPGEFLERAFLNDKIDLTQAEAIADLISASSEKAARSAINSLQGLFSKKIHELLEGIIFIRTFIEASIDFADEEIDPMDKKSLENQLNTVLDKLNEIKESAKQGTLLKEGMNLVIAGKPNVGKSSLLNCLSGRESAIVTDIAGTTRDVLKEYIHIDGMPLHIIDTAGLRDTDDVIEKEGVKRAFKEVEKADEVLLVVDQSKTDENDCDLLLQGIKEKLPIGAAITLIENKIDLTGQTPRIEEKETLTKIYLSVKTGQGIELLKRHLEKRMGFNAKAEGLFIARRRHLEAISKAKEAIEFSLSSLKQNQSEELVAEHLRYAQNALSEITGEFTSDDLLCEIFRTFCLGK